MPPGVKVCMLRLKLLCRSLCLMRVYSLNSSAHTVIPGGNYALRRFKTNESTILLGDFNAHVANDALVWKSVISQHGDADINDNGRLLLQLCCNNALCIMNTFFQHRDLLKHTWCWDALDQWSLTDFCIVSADLSQSVLDVRVSLGRLCPFKACRWHDRAFWSYVQP